MEPIFSMTTLRHSPAKVKPAEREDAAFEARLSESVGRGIADIEAGRYTTSVEDVFGQARELRNQDA